MLTFAYPWLIAVLPLAIAARRWTPPYRQTRVGLRVPFLQRLSSASGEAPTAGAVVLQDGWARTFVLAAAWLCVVAALARPQWLEPPISRTIPTRDMMLAVDLSGSMGTKDFTDASGAKTDRLTAVKQVLDDFLTRRKGDRVGLIVFGNAPFVQAPFTDDLNVCRELLAETQVGMAGPKTAFGDAIGLAINVFDRSEVPEKVLIILTDGNDTASRVPPANAAAVAKDKRVVVHAVAVGDPRAAGEDKLDEEALKAVASTTGGTYSHAGSRSELEGVYRKLDEIKTREAKVVSHRPRRDLFHWPLAAALLLGFTPAVFVLFAGRRGGSAAASGKAA